MAYFRGIFFANMGGGVVRIILKSFKLVAFSFVVSTLCLNRLIECCFAPPSNR